MPSTVRTEPERRFDFRGGLNTVGSLEVVSKTEVRRAKNLSLYEYGMLTTRGGSQRLHDTALAGSVTGLFRWFKVGAPGAGWQTLAVAGGTLYKKADAALDFTVVSAGFSLTQNTRFALWRDGGIMYVYLCDGTGLWKWDGGFLTAIATAPACGFIRPYKSRIYVAGDPTAVKRFYGSKLNDPTLWSVAAGGVLGDAEQYDHAGINGLAVVGSSMLIFKDDAVQRWTGITSADFNLGRDSEGLSRRIGCIAPDTIVERDTAVHWLSDLGFYTGNEGGILPISEKIEDAWYNAGRQFWTRSVASWNPDFKELRVWIPGTGQVANLTGYCFNERLNAWTGPWVRRNNGDTADLQMTAAAEYELATGESLEMFGCSDGFVRVSDGQDKDDVLRNGAGGAAIAWDVQWPTLHFGGLQYEKGLDDLMVAMDLPVGQNATAYWSVDGAAEETATVPGVGGGMQNYDFGRLGAVGKRVTFGLRGSATVAVRIGGFELFADILRSS